MEDAKSRASCEQKMSINGLFVPVVVINPTLLSILQIRPTIAALDPDTPPKVPVPGSGLVSLAA